MRRFGPLAVEIDRAAGRRGKLARQQGQEILGAVRPRPGRPPAPFSRGEVPGTAFGRGQPDLPVGAVLVDDVGAAVGQLDLQDAALQVDLQPVAQPVLDLLKQAVQHLAGFTLEFDLVHGWGLTLEAFWPTRGGLTNSARENKAMKMAMTMPAAPLARAGPLRYNPADF